MPLNASEVCSTVQMTSLAHQRHSKVTTDMKCVNGKHVITLESLWMHQPNPGKVYQPSHLAHFR